AAITSRPTCFGGIASIVHPNPTRALKQPLVKSPPSSTYASMDSSTSLPRGEVPHSRHRSQNRPVTQPQATIGSVLDRPSHTLCTLSLEPSARYGRLAQATPASSQP